MTIPYGASEIIALRSKGKRPADMVLVSLVGPLREVNPVVIARPERSYDWRFLTGLEVMVVAAMNVPSEQIARVRNSILGVSPAYLGIWFADLQNGLTLAFGGWHPKAKACRVMGFADRLALKGLGK